MAIPIGGGVDDDLQAFGAGGPAVVATIERTDIGGRCRRRSARLDLLKLRSVVRGKEDIMMIEIKAMGSGAGKPDQC